MPVFEFGLADARGHLVDHLVEEAGRHLLDPVLLLVLGGTFSGRLGHLLLFRLLQAIIVRWFEFCAT